MTHIFISYSRKDVDFAQKIVDALAVNNLDTWIDWKSIPKGEDWEQEIYRGIEEADAFLFLISPDSVASQMCNKEIAHAVKNGKRILPIFIANVDDRGIYGVTEKFLHEEQKKEICRRNFITCRDGRDDFNKAIEEIRTTIHTDYEWLKYHTELQVKALKWEQKKDTSRLLRGKELREAADQLTKASQAKDPSPTELQRNYLFESKKYQKDLISWISAILVVTMAVIVVLAVWWPDLSRVRAIPGNWVTIPGGDFTMGMDEREAEYAHSSCIEYASGSDKNLCPSKDGLLEMNGRLVNATLPVFDIMDNEVTNAQYQQCVSAEKCALPGGWIYEATGINKPAIGLNWTEAMTYCQWLGGRLPTEGEWEKAARGPNDYQFPWGQDLDLLKTKANLEKYGDGGIENIDTYAKNDINDYHVSNMAGNVREWTASANSPHSAGEIFSNDVITIDEIGQITRVITRGGAWDSVRSEGMTSYRGPFRPLFRMATTGFRCVCPDSKTCKIPWDLWWIWRGEYYLNH
jgi:formylglycine-generating enzyme required for sulfatase activity